MPKKYNYYINGIYILMWQTGIEIMHKPLYCVHVHILDVEIKINA